MRTLKVVFILFCLHWAVGPSLLAQSSQRTELLSFSDSTLTESLSDTLLFVTEPPHLLPSASSPAFTFHQKENTILLYLHNPDNQLTLRVTDSIGNTVQATERNDLDEGFYEFILFKESVRSGLYTIRLVVNEQFSNFQVSP